MQLALRWSVCRRRQLDVLRTQQAGLAELGGGVGGQVDVAIEAHRHQRMPALAFDLRHIADRHVGDPHPRVLLEIIDIGHLRLDHEGARSACPGCPAAAANSARASRRSQISRIVTATASIRLAAARRRPLISSATSRGHHHAGQAGGGIGRDRRGAARSEAALRRPGVRSGPRSAARGGPTWRGRRNGRWRRAERSRAASIPRCR